MQHEQLEEHIGDAVEHKADALPPVVLDDGCVRGAQDVRRWFVRSVLVFRSRYLIR